MDFSIRLTNGLILRGFVKSPGSEAKAVVIMVHGIGEHIGRYVNWAEEFRRENIGFTGVDLPGHGLSEGRRGHIRDYFLLDEIIDTMINECRKFFPEVPAFLYGHSLGGGIVLNYLLNNDSSVNGAIVTSPWLKLTFEPSKSKVMLAGIIKNVLPGFTQRSGLDVSHLSQNREIVEKYVSDPLVHDRISAGLFHGAMQAASNVLQNAARLKKPVLLMHGNSDQICSPDGSREFSSATEMAELMIWEGGYHELHNEPFSKDVLKYIVNWIFARVK
ncbi:MAG: alpha/beta hydrolase [Bacteroidales bacterium]|jgi:alpha-beta hydrolase superfamily lysophospholipase|nr:alpha/beta hydrolase [Bacteroidales bacterium]